MGVLVGSTDRHSHILYGVDDGISTLDESLQCLDFYEHHGLKDLWLTPHVMEDIPNKTEDLKAAFHNLYATYVPEGESANGKVRLHLAAEYMLDTVFEQRLAARDLLTMENNVVLVETSSWAPPVNFYELLSKTLSAGYRPLLAHVERYRYMTTLDYDKLHQMGVWMQMNFPSLVGTYGEHSRERAQKLLSKGYYCCAGSDCHRFKVLVEQCTKDALTKSEAAQLVELLHNNI